MALAGASILGAVTGNSLLFRGHHSKTTSGLLSSSINQSAIVPNGASGTAAGADTIFAGAPNLLISIGGVDTLGSGRELIEFLGGHHGGHGSTSGGTQHTLGGGTDISFAASGNLTLLGGGYTDLTPAVIPHSDSPGGASQMIATVFGAATTGGSLPLDYHAPQHGGTNAPVASVGGAAPDLLVGWTFGQPGYTLDFSTQNQPGTTGGARLRDGTEVQIVGLPNHGVVEVSFNKTT